VSQHFGKILRFDASRGVGLIRSVPDFTDGIVFSVENTYLPGGRHPEIGDEVAFDRSHRQGRPVAVNIKLNEQAPAADESDPLPWLDHDGSRGGRAPARYWRHRKRRLVASPSLAMIAPNAEELTINAGGTILGGWTRIRVTRGVELLPSHFDIELTERFPGQATQVVVEPTSTCTVSLGGDLVLTGYIDRYMPQYDKHQHRVRLLGRSKTQDIVDCSIDIIKIGWEVRANTIGQAAKILCAPYNINVVLPDGDQELPGTLKAVSIYPGYTGFFILEELARSVAMLIWDDANGNLVISMGGTGGRAGSAVVEGVNAERVDVVFAADQRYATYYVLGQGQDQQNGHINFAATASDPNAGKLRNRLRVIPQEIPDPQQEFSQKRANFEANRRYGRSRLAKVLVTGWRDGAGALWAANKIVNVSLPTAKVSEDRCISEVTFMRSEEGTQTMLTLMPTVGLSVQPFQAILDTPT
jgi:prophage tail gpP-like protein